MAVIANPQYNRSIPVTKSDTVNIDGTVVSTTGLYQTAQNTKPIPCEALAVATAGLVVVVYEGGVTDSITCVAGQILPLRIIRVNSTNTVPTLFNALYTV